MPSITLTLPISGQVITAALHSGNYSALMTLLNGGLDDTNISSLSYSKLNVPSAAIAIAKINATGTPSSSTFLRGDAVWSAAGGLIGVQILSGAATYTPTAGTNKVIVECVGGGAAGGGAPAIASGVAFGGGGGAGAYAMSLLTSGFSGAAYSVGAGGAGASGAIGGAGGDTTWATTVIVAKGGAGGPVGVLNAQVLGGAGGLASASTGTEKTDGGAGEIAGAVGGGSNFSSSGGASRFGPGAMKRLNTAGNGNAATIPGGGGGGAIESSTTTARTGGAGAAGTIRVWEFA